MHADVEMDQLAYIESEGENVYASPPVKHVGDYTYKSSLNFDHQESIKQSNFEES